MKLISATDARLNLRSNAVTIPQLTTPGVQKILQAMRSVAQDERDEKHPDRPAMVGLAAPQVGELVRIILIDVNAAPDKPNYVPELRFFINPQIIHSSTNESLNREGCYSTGSICGAVYRPDKVTVKALDENGQEFVFVSENAFQARILQHEIDHLDGIRFPMRVRSSKQLYVVKKDEFQNFREHWETWEKLCPIEDWLEIYNTKL